MVIGRAGLCPVVSAPGARMRLLSSAPMKKLLSLLALGLAACASQQDAASPAGGARVTEAATTPLSDLNLVNAKIPPVLADARKDAYKPPAGVACTAIADEVAQLDAVLGADLDVPPSPDRPSLIERGGGLVGDTAVGALKGAAEGVIPFRGWVRKLTGAERHSREVAAAIAAGAVRRAYLKGLGQARGCSAPAAPAAAAAAASAASAP